MTEVRLGYNQLREIGSAVNKVQEDCFGFFPYIAIVMMPVKLNLTLRTVAQMTYTL
jgi:hypothetical protein